MLVGDSLMQYQFDALLAWQRRSGLALNCKHVEQPAPDTSRSRDLGSTTAARRRAAVRQLMVAAKYDTRTQDCSRSGLTLMMRRLNLLPISYAEIVRVLDSLFAPLGSNGVAVLNVGLWYGPLARLEAFAGGTEAALLYMRRSVAALVRAACTERRRQWPRLIWRESTPQHFRGGGEYNASSRFRSCKPITDDDAAAMHKKWSRPVHAAINAARRRGCPSSLSVLPAFWPLVSRYRDHEGYRSQTQTHSRRPDCTHFLPCSGSMMLLNQILVDGVAHVGHVSHRPSTPVQRPHGSLGLSEHRVRPRALRNQ
jgi:hypothetical protein